MIFGDLSDETSIKEYFENIRYGVVKTSGFSADYQEDEVCRNILFVRGKNDGVRYCAKVFFFFFNSHNKLQQYNKLQQVFFSAFKKNSRSYKQENVKRELHIAIELSKVVIERNSDDHYNPFIKLKVRYF